MLTTKAVVTLCVLSVSPQAVKRSSDYSGGDAVEAAVMNMVKKDIDDAAAPSNSTGSGDSAGRTSFELATATHWPGVSQDVVLIAPHEVRLAWREFMSASALTVQQVRNNNAQILYSWLRWPVDFWQCW